MKVVFATNNPNKLKEIRAVLSNVEVLSLADINIDTDIPEDHETLQENALQKAQFIHDRCKLPCFADDTGLEVDALNGRPGVFSARYAGPQCSSEDNMDLLLKEMDGCKNRSAQFRTVIAFIDGKDSHYFEGHVKGGILHEKKGAKGFGYDPLFMPEGYDISFAEMSQEEKNRISHRGIAVKKFSEWLNSRTSE